MTVIEEDPDGGSAKSPPENAASAPSEAAATAKGPQTAGEGVQEAEVAVQIAGEEMQIPSSDGQAARPGADDLPPVVEAEQVKVVEGVVKQVMKEGRGETPPKHATCFVNYRAWAGETKAKFDDTWEERQVREFICGHEKPNMKGLGLGIASMRAGERCLLQVAASLGYGKQGSFSFPHVPTNANLIYEVELLGFEPAKEGRAKGEMLVEERIAAADRWRVDGNDLFKAGQVKDAMQQYEMALGFMGDDFMFQLFGKYKEMADAVRLPCHLNLAACLLALEQYDEAIGHCSTVLADDASNVKALYRRGKARLALGQTDTAKEDFLKAAKLAPGDKQVAKELKVLNEHEKEVREKQKQMFKGIFKPQPEVEEEPPVQDTVLRGSWYRRLLLWLRSWVWPFGRT